MLTLLTGGARSGKSRYALELCEGSTRRYFVATAEPFDAEMSDRIRRHQIERDASFETVEEPIDLVEALTALPEATDVVIVDCLTLWLSNLMFYSGEEPGPDAGDPEIYPQISRFLELLEGELPWHLILVTNEVGMGIVPGDDLSRSFRDLAGKVNQLVAQRADRVVFMVSGLPMTLKS